MDLQMYVFQKFSYLQVTYNYLHKQKKKKAVASKVSKIGAENLKLNILISIENNDNIRHNYNLYRALFKN